MNLIIRKNEELICEREVLQSKQQLLDTIHDSLNDGSFMDRFSLISKGQLNDQELRLLILYFIDSVNVSSSTAPTVKFTTDVLRNLFKTE